MSISTFMCKCLITIMATATLLSLSAHAMPLSWRTGRHKRSGTASPPPRSTADPEHETPTAQATLNHVTSVEVPTQGGGSSSGSTEATPENSTDSNEGIPEATPENSTDSNERADSSPTPSSEDCRAHEPPQDMLDRLTKKVVSEPHPMFLLSEMAEKKHRDRHSQTAKDYCEGGQRLNATINFVKNHFKDYLNRLLPPNTNCSEKYEITYDPNRYPRYLVQVVCSNEFSENCSCSASQSRCETHRPSSVMYYYLSRGSCSQGVPHSQNSTWTECLDDQVGVGCKCRSSS